jgi:predicted ABC-type transport system involved in lysophospholipase L1 biosynthesis ATPase subunit
MVTHDPSLAERYAHRTLTMLDGQIIGEASGVSA